MKERANALLQKLNFDEWIELYNKLPAGNKMIDMVFERMEELDEDRFDKWMDEYFGF